jgi:phenylalanyl-tRNA synthetase beta chain
LCDLGATAYQPHAFGAAVESAVPITLRVADIERLLGLTLPDVRIAAHLCALGCEVASGRASLSVTPPLWRRDLTTAVDLVEEVARVEGYERIPAAVPSVPPHEISSAAFTLENRLARALAGLGYREVITHSLRPGADAGAVEILNPLSEEHRLLRSSLVPGLIDYLAAPGSATRVFEIGDVFSSDEDRVVERTALAFGFSAGSSGEPPWRDSSFLRLKGDCEALLREVSGRTAETTPARRPGFHPGKSATVTIGDAEVGVVGCIDPRLTRSRDVKGNAYVCVLDVASLPAYETPRYRPPSRFPSTYRDLALTVETTTHAGEIERAIANALGPLCTEVKVFDEYRGPQVEERRKSLAVRITLQRLDATITDDEADAAVERVLDVLRERFGATIRT